MTLLHFSRQPVDPTIAALEREAAKIDQRTRETEQFLRDEPKRIAAAEAERAATLPPPDDFADRRREDRFYRLACRGQIRNERRAQAGSALLFVLLLLAAGALFMWVMRITT